MDTYKIEKSIQLVEDWMEKKQFRSYEPFDGLSSFLKPLTFKNILAERLLQQLVRQSPVNLRPLLGIKSLDSTKGRGYAAWGYLKRYQLNNDKQYLEKAKKNLLWLNNNTSPGYAHPSWGNHFDFTSRAGRLPKLEPIIVWTSLIGQTFIDAYEITHEDKYLQIAKEICNWILNLPRERTQSGACLSYVMYTQSSIHNSNMLGAAMLARTYSITGNKELFHVAKEAMEYSCSRQLKDGSWYYGEGITTRWIDNFHTGYNLDSLKIYIDSTKDYDYNENLKKGLQYYISTFFTNKGAPKYYHNRLFPIDIQCASQSIDTLTFLSNDSEQSFELAKKVADWTIDTMQDKKGYFYYRQLPMIKVKTPMMHWGQATMYKALTNLNLVMHTKE
jgi:rhamnogalacturonyl hydrolase YesR